MELELTGSRAEQQHRAVVSDPVGRRASAALRVFAIAAIGLVLTACGGGGGSSSGGGGNGGSGGVGNVTVTVTDEQDVKLPAASVTAGTKTGTTAADGTVTLSGIPAGSTSVSASKDLYNSASRSVTIVKDSTATTTVKITRKKGSIAATVTDQFDTPIQNATITAAVDGKNFTGKSAADGKVTLANIPTGAVAVSVAADGFIPAAQSIVVTEDLATDFPIKLVRITQAAGGFVLSRVDVPPTNNGQTLQFMVQLLVVDEASDAVEGLTASNFTLQPCRIDTTVSGPECVRAIPAKDVGYSAPSAAPDASARIGGLTAVPYAAAILMDQSNSIETSDPTDARIFAGKVFMGGVIGDDRVILSAFAETSGTNVAKIPEQPLTKYPVLSPGFEADGTIFFSDLDMLAKQEGGKTPLYSSLNSMIDYTSANAPPGILNQRKAVVLFSDGDDTVCLDEKTCRDDTVINALAKGVDLFTIGLSDKVDFESMAELADRANGVFLFAENAEQLVPIYGALGRLLSRSLTTYEVTWTIQADEPGTFKSGNKVLGKVTVNIGPGANPVNLPIIVRIP